MPASFAPRQQLLILTGLLCLLFGFATRALALPAPLEEDELQAESDLIIEGEVLSIRNLGRANYLALIRVDKTIKGRAPQNPFRYEWNPPTPGLPGEMNHNVFAGQRLRLYLIFERGYYVPWASNSVDWLADLPEEQQILPHKAGQVIYAPGVQGMQPATPAPDKACCCTCRPVRRWRCR